MIKKILLFFFILLNLYADDNLAKAAFNLEIGKNGEANPRLFFPIHWNENFYSGLGYGAQKVFEHQVLDPTYGDNRTAMMVQQELIRVNLLTYEQKINEYTFSVGGEYRIIDIEKNEFGYFQMPTDSSYQTYNNEIEINVRQPALYLDASYQKNWFNARLSGFMGIATDLRVKQETRIKPLVSSTGKENSSQIQDPSHELRLDIQFNLPKGVNIILTSLKQYLPMDYNLKTLTGDDAVGYSFAQEDIAVEENTDVNIAKIQFTQVDLGGMMPVIGTGTKKIETTTNGYTSTYDETMTVFGFEKLF